MSDENEPGHGNSPAAWVAVIIMLVAFTIGTLAFWFDLPGSSGPRPGLLVVGAIIGVVLSKLGYGVKGPKYVPKAHS